MCNRLRFAFLHYILFQFVARNGTGPRNKSQMTAKVTVRGGANFSLLTKTVLDRSYTGNAVKEIVRCHFCCKSVPARLACDVRKFLANDSGSFLQSPSVRRLPVFDGSPKLIPIHEMLFVNFSLSFL
ncbi:hypothetical protein GWI33_000170 [Rhynchophorus ferrugineus]|uniref:Secreted protein n=1 Tax=Rhynchophorus ferrugineus TaxID=354439 RepID=A0A834MLQ6_RHYFE|nr:hypothetical protein GWI33_000170 [Rhynchophorus ferrugineus]